MNEAFDMLEKGGYNPYEHGFVQEEEEKQKRKEVFSSVGKQEQEQPLPVVAGSMQAPVNAEFGGTPAFSSVTPLKDYSSENFKYTQPPAGKLGGYMSMLDGTMGKDKPEETPEEKEKRLSKKKTTL